MSERDIGTSDGGSSATALAANVAMEQTMRIQTRSDGKQAEQFRCT
jgi:hypothetical protein